MRARVYTLMGNRGREVPLHIYAPAPPGDYTLYSGKCKIPGALLATYSFSFPLFYTFAPMGKRCIIISWTHVKYSGGVLFATMERKMDAGRAEARDVAEEKEDYSIYIHIYI